MPDFTLLLVSHNKPELVREAVQSVLAQTHQNWEAILIDSGVLLNQGHFNFLTDRRFKVIPSGETGEIARTHNMASWCFNRVLNEGRANGEIIFYLCDDDLIYPNAFATYWDYYTRQNCGPQAMYASQDIGLIDAQGRTNIIGQRRARRPAGKFCRGAKLDCRVDYLQFCHTAKILEKFAAVHGHTRYHCEDKAEAHHADGIFMEQIGALTTVHPIDVVTSINRRSADSANIAYSATRLGRLRVILAAKWKGLLRRWQKKG